MVDPLTGLTLVSKAAKHWKMIAFWVSVVGLGAAVGIYIAILKGNLADVTEDRNALKTTQDEVVGGVRSSLIRLDISRTVTIDTVDDEFAWLVGEYETVNEALRIQTEALERAQRDARAVRRQLDVELRRVAELRVARENLRQQLLQEGREGGLTEEEWSQL